MTLIGSIRSQVGQWTDDAQRWLICDQRALYGSAAARIFSGIAVTGLLVTNLRWRDLVFGPGSVWSQGEVDAFPYWPPHLFDHVGSSVFLLVYLLIIAAAVAWTAGWHVKPAGVVILIGHVACVQRTPYLGDSGDSAVRVGLLIMLFMNVTEYWALDSRRRARPSPAVRAGQGLAARLGTAVKRLWRGQTVLPRWLGNGLHNVAVATVAFQIVVIYIAAGMFKTRGEVWQNGTALYYPLQLAEFRPLPFMSDLMTRFDLVIGVVTYVVVFTQLFFPLLLVVSVATRRIAIFIVMVFHVSIAIFMALPWFSAMLIALDSIFISSSTYAFLDQWVRKRSREVVDLFRVRPASPARRAGDP
jgi:hypothetical protein